MSVLSTKIRFSQFTSVGVLLRICQDHMHKKKIDKSLWGECQKCPGFKTCPNFTHTKVDPPGFSRN
jgi:hypothetical protein